jgi:tRNA modification GTPase
MRLLSDVFQPLGKTARSPFREENRAALVPGQFWLGKLTDPALGIGDEVVVVVKSFSPQPYLEIQCHGGLQVIALLEELFSKMGVQVCTWKQFLRRTGHDALQVAALEALSQAATLRTAAILLDQYQGAFAAAVRSILATLQQEKRDQAAKELWELARWTHLGRHLNHTWRVVVFGAPNVGKSSLVNRLAGYQRCVVSPTPGTTRDLVTTRIAIDGWPVELIDTAGMHDQADTLEAKGIQLAQAAAANADLRLWVLDASTAPVEPNSLMEYQIVINKTDLPAAWDLSQFARAPRVSAETGAGLDDLVNKLSRWLIGDIPGPGQAVPFTPALCDAVSNAQEAFRIDDWANVQGLLSSALHYEFPAQDVK